MFTSRMCVLQASSCAIWLWKLWCPASWLPLQKLVCKTARRPKHTGWRPCNATRLCGGGGVTAWKNANRSPEVFEQG